jgi:pilus assembly protein CpaB
MDAKKIMLIVGALVVAVAAAFGVNVMMRGAAAEQAKASAAPEMDGPMVMVATRPLPVGTILDADAVRFQPWPNDLVEKNYFIKGTATREALVGSVVRYAVTAGQPLTQGSLVNPGDRGFLAAALGPGMRAITVSVSNETSAGGFIFPGDRVDLMLTAELAVKEEGDERPFRSTETIVRNVRVLATDQRVDAKDENGKQKVEKFSSVTLEVTPRIAEKIQVAIATGRLSLSLRSIADNAAELERAIAAGEISVPKGGDPKREREMLLQAGSRPVDTDTSVVTGGDVSRYQRSSLPPRRRPVVTRDMQARDTGGYSAPQASAPQTAAPAAPKGPVVRVVRSGNVTEVPVGR